MPKGNQHHIISLEKRTRSNHDHDLGATTAIPGIIINLRRTNAIFVYLLAGASEDAGKLRKHHNVKKLYRMFQDPMLEETVAQYLTGWQ